jgi:3-oxoacyl-[acyl-carrier-protein] synthase III
MDGNSSFQHTNTSVLSIVAAEASVVVTSATFDEQLATAYARLGLRPGLLEGLAGIKERRWWPDGVTFADGAVMAGEKAIAAAGVDPARIGLMINSSVSRAFLEPSTAVEIHHKLELPTSCVNFDLANACLGFVNGIHLAATMIDAGHLDYALVVNGEDSQGIQERTIERLSRPEATSEEFFNEFASLTLGSGAAAMVLGRTDLHPEGHRVVGGVARAGTEHHDLCVGDLEKMRTDTRGLMEAGLDLAEAAWHGAKDTFDWTDLDRYIVHQVSSVHTSALCQRLEIDQARVPLTFPTFGNIGPASLPFTLALEADSLAPGDRLLCMGIGSGLNTAFCEIVW